MNIVTVGYSSDMNCRCRPNANELIKLYTATHIYICKLCIRLLSQATHRI